MFEPNKSEWKNYWPLDVFPTFLRKYVFDGWCRLVRSEKEGGGGFDRTRPLNLHHVKENARSTHNSQTLASLFVTKLWSSCHIFFLLLLIFFPSCKVEIGKEVELDVDLYSLWGEVSAVFHNFQLCGKIQGNLVMAFDPFAAVHPRKLIELLLDTEPERERILDHFSAQNSSS